MPRLLPRILKELAKGAEADDFAVPFVKRNTRQGRQMLQLVGDYVHRGRTKSILLDTPNPFTDRPLFRRHKTPKDAFGPVTLEMQEMQEAEREWSSNPYREWDDHRFAGSHRGCLLGQVRMLASPVRKCVVSRLYMPRGEYEAGFFDVFLWH